MADAAAPNLPPFHVIALDMDGTLFNPEHEITDFTRKTIQDVVAKYPTQVFVVLASGRHYLDLKPILDSLELPKENGSIVACNGACAYAYDFNTDSVVVREGKEGAEKVIPVERQRHDLIQVANETISPENVCQIMSMWLDYENKEINLHVYQDDRWLCAMEEKEILKYSHISGFEYELFSPLERIQTYNGYKKRRMDKCTDDSTTADYSNSSITNPFDGIVKFFLSCKNHELLVDFRSRILNEIPSLSIAFSTKCFLEIMSMDVSKLTGLQSLIPHLQACAKTIKSSRDASSKESGKMESEMSWTVESTCIAFGDNENDVPMLVRAAKGCLMGNSSAELKENLKRDVVVVGTNSEDGVARELKKIFKV